MENNFNLSDAAKAARRAYKNNWNRKNPDKVRAAQARYWEKQARKKVSRVEHEKDGVQN